MELDIIKQIGLNDSQAKGYMALLKNGAMSPSELSEKTGEERSNCYAICHKLESLGLAKLVEGDNTKFKAESPIKLKQLLANKQQSLKSASSDLSSALPGLLSEYCLNNNVTEIINVSGKEAIAMAYDSMINTNQDIFLLSNGGSRYKCNLELLEFMKKQAIRLKEANIKTYKLIETEKYDPNKIHSLRLIKPLPDVIKLDIRIMIFGNNVIFSKFYDSDIYSTIISSNEIANSLKSIFYALWNQNIQNNPKYPELDTILPVNN